MPGEIKIQVAAFPGAIYRRLKPDLEILQREEMPERAEVRFVQSRNDYLPEIMTAEFRQIEANIQDGFVHIGVLPTRTYDTLRPFTMDCRIVRLDVGGNLQRLSIEEFRSAVFRVVEYEKRWCAVIQPDNWHHPLWLPPPSFEVDSDLKDYWKRCDCYQRTDRIEVAHNLVQSIISKHRVSEKSRGSYWLDIRSRRFRVDKSRHGMTPEERAGKRRFRFASEVPIGFHYDVQRMDEGKFTICSPAKTHHGCTRVNVNPWGHVVVKA